MHARAQIRAVVAELLASCPTTAAKPVINGRNYPLDDSELPCLAVFARDETIGEANAFGPSGAVTERVLELVIAGVVKATDDDDLVDTIALEVERVMFAADLPPSGALAAIGVGVELQATTISANIGTDRSMRVIELTYNAHYRLAAGAPDQIIR
jgi:hypothetical protein